VVGAAAEVGDASWAVVGGADVAGGVDSAAEAACRRTPRRNREVCESISLRVNRAERG
jgi:hypothetical protein